eukprot:scaffold577391_cov43-Prasinocladus_malaysianus.AAC.1
MCLADATPEQAAGAATPASPTATGPSRPSTAAASSVRASSATAATARPTTAPASRKASTTGLPRPGQSKAAPAAQAIVEEVVADAATFLMDDKKEVREKRCRGGFKPLNNANEEAAELESALAGVTAPHAVKLMFSKDCGKHIEACALVMSALEDPDLNEALHSNLDRVLHWLRLRMGDGNTQCL